MSTTLLIGIFCLGFGLLTLAARLFGWTQLLGKKEPMEVRFGPRYGNVIHILAYTILPFVIGLVLVSAELRLF
jgi:hypothetical protein